VAAIENCAILSLCCAPSGASIAPLELPEGWRCTVANAVPEGIERDAFDVVIVDARGVVEPDRTCELVQQAVARMPRTRAIVLLSEESSEKIASSAVEAGAWDVAIAAEPSAKMWERISCAARLHRLHRPARDGSNGASEEDQEDEEPLQMVGTSPAIRSIFGMIRRVASCDVPVLLTGESGTGKELTALAIHDRSQRSDKPFVPINCGAIPDALLESELFGHEKGSFTGASQSRKGRFEAAEGGTIFLDEIGDLAPSLQAKLLRFLQDHVVERVGGRTGIPLDVRVVAATNRDIAVMAKHGEFREDLYFRLAVLLIEMPPLRERGDDVILMARFFLKRYARESERSFRGFSRSAIEAMLQYAWPGNVRELINRVRRAVVLADGALIESADLGLEALAIAAPVPTLRAARSEAELRTLRAALLRTNGNKAEAAKLLGISRTQLYELMGRHRMPVQNSLAAG
jgi:DNA-binding NtrC family response regulator